MTQHNGTDLTEYLIDQQPSLAVILRQKIGSQNTHYVHGLRGVQSQVVNSAWTEVMSDGLGSVRGWLNSSQAFTDTNTFDPYGVPDSAVTGFGFTGEMTDDNGLVYLRARYYQPSIGTFTALDPFEGVNSRPMSMNGYSWVEGNVANWVDPSGRCWANPSTPNELKKECRDSWDRIFPHNIGRVGGSCNDTDIRFLFSYMGGLSHVDFFSTIQSQLFQDRIATIGIPVFDECGNIIISCSQILTRIPMPLPTPTPTPTNDPIYVYFGGAEANPVTGFVDIYLPTNESFARSQAPLLAGRADYVIPYPGAPNRDNTPLGTIVGKQKHANDGLARVPSNQNVYAYGYSAGADSALLFANQYQGTIVALGIIGGTLDGSVSGFGGANTLRSDTNLNNIPDWQDIINRLLNAGTRVVVVDDQIGGKPDWVTFNSTVNQNPNYCYLSRDILHYGDTSNTTATNRSSSVAQDVFNFMDNGVCNP